MNRPLPPLTAILTCRNDGWALGAALEHLGEQGASVIVVDHGSTDDTDAIARSFMGRHVLDVIHEPFEGMFDLTRQLELKAELIRARGEGWVVHCDVDEFLACPSGRSLREACADWDDLGVLTAGASERLFLPRSEEEHHAPETFRQTLEYFARVARRDVKQRVFRWDAPLEPWFETGGHTVSRSQDEIAPGMLDLDHYLGLSLDHLRRQYHGRVFAPRDLAKRWHTTRQSSQPLVVKAPSAEHLAKRGDGEPPIVPDLPVFFQADSEEFVALEEPVDLVVISENADAAGRVLAAWPGLRIAAVKTLPPACRHPVLNVLSHPAGSGGSEGAVAWLSRLARARQLALLSGFCYREVREDELASDLACVPGLLLRKGPRYAFILGGEKEEVVAPRWEAANKAITGEMARELGYG